MVIGPYSGASALAAYEKWQESIASNIAYASIPGYKKSDVSFDSIASANNGGTGNSSENLPKAGEVIDFSPGTLQHTGQDLDFAIQGKGFFQVKRTDGSLAYTRDGEFQLNNSRVLMTKGGDTVMGSSGAPITLSAEGGKVSVSPDGALSQGDTQVGKIPVYEFQDTKGLVRSGDGLFTTGDSGGRPEQAKKPEILNGVLENSNVSSLTEMVNLINVSRAYEASRKVISSYDDDGDKSIDALGSPPSPNS